MEPSFRRALCVAFIFFGCLGVATMAWAQDLQIKGPADMDVYIVNERGRSMVGTVGSDGHLDVPGRIADRDKDFEVVLENAPAHRSVALVERGRTDEFCQDQSPAGSRCRYTGTFLKWGRLRQLNISDTGEVTVEGGRVADNGDDDEGLKWGVGWIADADIARAFVSDTDRVCREAQALVNSVAIGFACSNDSEVNAWSADVGLTFARFIALKVGYLQLGRIDFNLGGAIDDNTATVQGHFGRVRGATFTGVFRVDLGPVVPFVEAGAWRWSADTGASLTVTGGTPISLSSSRTVTGWNPIVGAGIEVWPVRYVGFSGGIRWIPISEDISSAEDLVRLDDSFKVVFVGIKLGSR